MRHEEIPNDLRGLAYDFFFWFSRFEYALKEARILKHDQVGSPAEPGWTKFIAAFEANYQICDAGRALIVANPKRQIVADVGLNFRDVGFNANASHLERVVRLAQTVRNNLFHGGKHDSAYWDEAERTRNLLAMVIAVLDDLAEQAGLASDYRSEY